MRISPVRSSTLSSRSTLGEDTPQVSARSKVLGQALYSGDLKLPGMLHAKVLRSPYASAAITRISYEAALALPGVVAVLTGRDAPKTMWGGHHKERRILAEDCVRFAGEEVAAVVAETEDIAREALDLIEVEYTELPALLTPDEAVAEGAQGIHPGRNNIAKHIQFERGDVDQGFAQAALIHEEVYETHAQYPGYLEPMRYGHRLSPLSWLEPVWRLALKYRSRECGCIKPPRVGALAAKLSKTIIIYLPVYWL
jgi:CO/xanthine dehydrogenase Mo-binding subunit